MGGSISSSRNRSDKEFDQRGWGPQDDAAGGFFNAGQDLWNNSGDMFNQLAGMADQITPYLQQIGLNAANPWENQNQGGAGAGVSDATMQGLTDSLNTSLAGGQSQTGKMYEDIVGGAGNSYADPLADQMAQDSQYNLNRNIMPTIRGGAAGAGQGGSSRHGIAEGIAASDEARNLAGRQTAMREKNYDKDLNWKMNIAQQADQQLGASQDRAMNLINGVNDSQRYGLGQSGMMQDLGLGTMDAFNQAMQNPYDAYTQWSQAGGFSDPSILSFGSGDSRGSSFGASGGYGGGKS